MSAEMDVGAIVPEEPERLKRLLTLVCHCSQLRNQASDEIQLHDWICRALVEEGCYALAYTGMPNPETPAGNLVLTSARGRVALPTYWPEQPEGIPLQEDAHRLTLPLIHQGANLGCLRIEADPGYAYTAEERGALAQLADDLAYGLASLRAKARQQAQAAQLRQLSRALESSSNGVMITSSIQLDHPIVYVNPAFEAITGYRADEVIGSAGRFLVRDDLNQKGLNDIRDALRNHREGHAILRNYRKDGSLFWNELYISPVRDEEGAITTHFVSIINDVTARIDYERQLEYHANHDTLTGLANRNLLGDRISQALIQARYHQRLVGVLLLDLDRFKLINDGFGHNAADNLLKAVAERLGQAVRETDTVARLGGDEFVVVITDVASDDDIAVVANKIMRTLALPFTMEGKEIFVTASIGAAVYPRDGEHGEGLLRNADVAMYRVKEHGRNNYRFYAPEMGQMALDRLDMEGNLRRALERDELAVFYQPLVSLATGRIVGAEALVRWNHPRIGLIHPGEFIPLAEDTGLIIPLGDLVMRRACRDAQAWLAAGLPSLRLSINISARQFRQENLADHIRAVLADTGLVASSLEFELTESMVMHDVETTQVTLRELKELGISLALDDFGTGYSSLSYLKRFPIDTLKIDRSFVRDIPENEDDSAIAHAVIAMAHSLGLRVVAEGVEKEAQLETLRHYACDDFQGYLFSRPVPAEEFVMLLRNDKHCPPPDTQEEA